MSDIKSLSYQDFGKMEFLDFFPRTSGYEEDDIDGIDYGTGYAAKKGYASTLFAKSGPTKETTLILLEFTDDCPEREAHRLLDSLGLGLRKGMPRERVLRELGSPERDSGMFLRFVLGSRWPYYVGCSIDPRNGLFRLFIARKDFVDKNEVNG